MARQTIEQTRAELHQLGTKLGIPRESVTEAIDKCADDSDIRRLRRKWRERANSIDHQFARRLRAEEDQRWAEQAIDIHGERLVDEARNRRSTRAQMCLGARLDVALNGIGTLSTPGSSWQTGGGGRSSERPAGPPPAELVDVSIEVTAITVLVELLEDKLDAERGLLAPVDYAKMPTADKNKMLARLAGVHAKRVSELFPFLGSERTIRNYRREWGMVPSTGLPKQETVVEEVRAA